MKLIISSNLLHKESLLRCVNKQQKTTPHIFALLDTNQHTKKKKKENNSTCLLERYSCIRCYVFHG